MFAVSRVGERERLLLMAVLFNDSSRRGKAFVCSPRVAFCASRVLCASPVYNRCVFELLSSDAIYSSSGMPLGDVDGPYTSCPTR